DSGVRQHGGRLIESYNNLGCMLSDTLEAKTDVAFCEARDGEFVAFNNYIQTTAAQGLGKGSVAQWSPPGAVGNNTCADWEGFDFGADGLNWCDENRKEQFNDPSTGLTHYPYVGYTHTQHSGG